MEKGTVAIFSSQQSLYLCSTLVFELAKKDIIIGVALGQAAQAKKKGPGLTTGKPVILLLFSPPPPIFA